jgi:hypothetical protein
VTKRHLGEGSIRRPELNQVVYFHAGDKEVPYTVHVTLLPPFSCPLEKTKHVKFPVSRVWKPVKE